MKPFEVWAQVVSAAAAVAVFFVAAYQLRGLRTDARSARANAISGVCVVTKVVSRPPEGNSDGFSFWKFEFRAVNPGDFAISNVQVSIDFTIDVERAHFTGRRDAPTRSLELGAPVVPARDDLRWIRTIRILHDDRHDLPKTTAKISFTTPDAGEWQNLWPAPVTAGRKDQRLIRMLNQGR